MLAAGIQATIMCRVLPRRFRVNENMNMIVRGQGTTKSERYLAKLADRTFLNLWSYPNVFIDKKVGAKGDGKEACDLFVVCGDHILIFSDKAIAWPDGGDIELAWRRWFKRSIQHSVNQIRGAQRWLSDFPDRLFLDPQCTQRLPFPLPPNDRMKVHGIVVALGAGKACREFCKGGTGNLMINPNIKGDDHIKEDGVIPFAIGDVDPSGSFIHVFDDATLDIVMTEMNTITDLTDYLSKKENLIRSGHLIGAPGEEELIAYYMTHMNAAQEHDFTKPDGSFWAKDDVFVIGEGHYYSLLRNAQYIAKKQVDKDSYIWDALIEAFTNHMLAGTTIVPDGEKFDLAQMEEGVRYMALVPRYLRRLYSQAIMGAMQLGISAPRMTRAFLPGPTETDKDTGFFFMTLAVPEVELSGGYEQYRRVRRNILETYALTFLRKNPNLKRIIGIATEPPAKSASSAGSSEDLLLAEPPEWSDETIKILEKRQRIFNVAREGRYKEYAMQGNEFPDVESSGRCDLDKSQLNRYQRRALKATTRRRKK